MTQQIPTPTKQQSDELVREKEIEEQRKEHYKRQLDILLHKKKTGQIKDPDNFKVKSIPIDLEEIKNLHRDFGET